MIMKPATRFLSAVVLMAAWSASIPVANAQAPAPDVSTPATPALPIPDQKLDAAAAAIKRVTAVQEAYRQRLAQAATPSDQQRIVTEANNALTKAVADQGLSVEEYNSILEVARNDPEVRGKVLQRMRPQGERE
jgi:hypothetical protein